MLLRSIPEPGAELPGFRLQGWRFGCRPDEPGVSGLHPDLPGRGKQPRHRLHPIQQQRRCGASHDGGKRATSAGHPDLRPAPRSDRIRNPVARDRYPWRRRLRGFALPGRRRGRESHVWGFRGGRRDGSQRGSQVCGDQQPRHVRQRVCGRRVCRDPSLDDVHRFGVVGDGNVFAAHEVGGCPRPVLRLPGLDGADVGVHLAPRHRRRAVWRGVEAVEGGEAMFCQTVQKDDRGPDAGMRNDLFHFSLGDVMRRACRYACSIPG